MKVIPVTPRGYCHGVVSAIQTLKTIAQDSSVKQPIHVLGMVVHNQKVVDDFRALGIRTLDDKNKSRLELLDLITEGTIVFTAHGVSAQVTDKARQKGLDIIDTTCPDVKTSQTLIRSYIETGHHVLFLGKHGHPESETAKSISCRVHVVETAHDIETLSIDAQKIALTNQTTLSFYDLYTHVELAKRKFPTLVVLEEICDATKQRQDAVMRLPQETDHLFVVGDARSSNANQLIKVAKRHGIAGTLIANVEALQPARLKAFNVVAVSAAASTPSLLTREVIDYLTAFDKENPASPVSAATKKNLFAPKKIPS